MILIDGKKAAAELREELKNEVDVLKAKYNKVPGLTVILIGDLTPSQIYVRNKEKSANEVGLKSEVLKFVKLNKKLLSFFFDINRLTWKSKRSTIFFNYFFNFNS